MAGGSKRFILISTVQNPLLEEVNSVGIGGNFDCRFLLRDCSPSDMSQEVIGKVPRINVHF